MFEGKADFYSQLTIHYIAEAKLLGHSACAIVEAENDVHFWSHMFLSHKLNPHFIYNTKHPSGNKTTGVAQCLKFKEHACKEFIICIDSDYRYLKKETDISAVNFILQTYTYSIENHYCHHNRFNSVCKLSCTVENNVFDFEKFFKQYSRCLFPLFLWHIYSMHNNVTELPADDFLAIINKSHEGITHCDIANNSKMIIDKLDKSCKEKIAFLETQYPGVRLDNLKSELAGLGVREDNVLLYIRGHNVYALIHKIGIEVVNGILEKEKEKLKGDSSAIGKLYKEKLPFEKSLLQCSFSFNYPEIMRIKDDISMLSKL